MIDPGYRVMVCPKCGGEKMQFVDAKLTVRRCIKCGYIIQEGEEMAVKGSIPTKRIRAVHWKLIRARPKKLEGIVPLCNVNTPIEKARALEYTKVEGHVTCSKCVREM